ncbi:hypothetical protein J2S65_001106 [Rhodococcus fascians]|nr:hypothetical protein [Rhodococcus fascians]
MTVPLLCLFFVVSLTTTTLWTRTFLHIGLHAYLVVHRTM